MLSPDIGKSFSFGDSIIYLNHGGFGVTPREVLANRIEWLRKIEEGPGAFVAFALHPAWNETAACVAQRFSVRKDDLALIENVTDGINAVLRSMAFQAGDEILVTSLVYGSVRIMAEHIARRQGAAVVEAHLAFPHPDPGQIVDAVRSAITPRTRLAILDHVTSSTALILPIAEMTKACKERGVAVLVDGAHVPGNIAFDIESCGADWYVANLHKWYFAPRGCGFLWAAPERQAGLAPAVLSWDAGREFPHSFEWTGTRDATTWLSLPAAFAFMDRFGEANVRAHNQALLRQGMALIEDRWGVRAGTPDAMIGSMGLVPLPDDMPYSADEAGRLQLQKALWDSFRIEASMSFSHEGRKWVRISAQIYNKLEDYEELASAILAMRSPDALRQMSREGRAQKR
jgi:isopenicillin-N epimerase